jgi:hypothetical protein
LCKGRAKGRVQLELITCLCHVIVTGSRARPGLSVAYIQSIHQTSKLCPPRLAAASPSQ